MTSQPEQLVVEGGIALACPTCAGSTFTRNGVTLITSRMANTGLNKRAEAAVCSRCGNIQFFVAGALRPAPAAPG
ncbi:hypothetical protein [Pimelobacter sp. 30-1]|uniref:hypothetical protein n=1 Tax=Pimelobacter sp. 30-1 TaxID=2004991 RepID=UPI001C045C8D|nr:hypothetical protein [Pimelobacter sp. 30-1]MBU2695855.1 hypothetical protein [Pimelobacter sp. 30-1]